MDIFGFFYSNQDYKLVDYLDQSAFDEKFMVEPDKDIIRNIYHVENKYFLPVRSGSFRELYEYGKQYMVPSDDIAFHEVMNPDTLMERLENADPKGLIKAECEEKLVDGSYRWVQYIGISGEDKGVPEGQVYFYVFDVQNQRDRIKGVITENRRVDNIDPLTGLRFKEAVIPAADEMMLAYPGEWCCLAIDIQHFKVFKDWFGADKSSFVLSRIGLVLQDFQRREKAVAAYFGRDNFCVIMLNNKNLIEALFAAVEEIIRSYTKSIGFMPAFGVYAIEEHEKLGLDAYDKARIAVGEAKESYSERIRFFDKLAYSKRKEEYAFLTEFQEALHKGEIGFYIQPQCSITDGRIIGGEALTRWIKPDGKVISPGAFIPFLEKHGFIEELDKAVWENVCIWIRSLIDRGIRPMPVSLNISQVELLSMDVAAYIYALTERYNIPTSLVKLEITESAFAEDLDMVSEQVARMKEKGFIVHMDDFGAGYSSLNMLDKINTDLLKLDMAFMRKKDALSKKGISIVESIISMTKMLGIPVIIEGVENADQVNFLRNLGCLYAQGYYFYKPMPVADIEELLKNPENMDFDEIKVRATDLFHTREFLNETLFTDTMLNNVLGPVAFYTQDADGTLSITRFNQQFYECIADVNMESRSKAIHNYIVEEDHPAFYKMLEDACSDPVHGGSCTVRFYKSGGGVFWYNMHLFFLRENEQGKLFYGKIADATGMHQQGAAFYEILKSDSDRCMRIDLAEGLIYELGKDMPFDDPNARVMNTKESLKLTAEKHIKDEEDRQRFLDFFSPERLKRSHSEGIYSEAMRVKFRMGRRYAMTNFSAYYIKFVPDQDDSVYVFVNAESE